MVAFLGGEHLYSLDWFNIADVGISIGAIAILLFYRFF